MPVVFTRQPVPAPPTGPGVVFIPPGVSGRYTSQARLVALYGAEEIRVWSNKNPSNKMTDEAAIKLAIAAAEGLMDSRLKKRYAMPLTGEDGTSPLSARDREILGAIADVLAGYELNRSRPNPANEEANTLKEQRADVLADLGLYVDGVQYLDAPRINRMPTAPGISLLP